MIVHLSCYSRFRDEFVCPPEMAQDGMARKLGISRAHAALELKRLKQRNLVESRLAHVMRAKTRRKVYNLTRAGEESANELKENAKQKRVRIIDGNGGLECSGLEALRMLCSQGMSESEAYSLMLTSDAITIPNDGRKCNVVDAEGFDGLFGRDQEMSRITRWFQSPGKAVCVLSGGEGMGKTALALLLFSNIHGPSIWTNVMPMQSVRSLLSSIGDELKGLGRLRLSSVMESETIDEREAVIALAEDTAGGLLVFDDVHNSPELEEFSSKFVSMNNWPLKVLLVCRRKPGFCQRWSDTFQKPYEDLSIGGLDLESTRKLLDSSGVRLTEEGLLALHGAIHGRPQDILLLTESGWTEGSQIPNTHDMLFAGMDEEERLFVGLAAVLQSPIDPMKMRLSEKETRLLKRSSLFTAHGNGYVLNGLLREIAPELFKAPELAVLHNRAAVAEDSMNNRIEAAHHYISAGQREKAVELLVALRDPLPWRTAALELLRLLRSIGDEPRLESLKGRVLQTLGKLDEARLSYEKALKFEEGSSLIDVLIALSEVEAKLSLLDDSEKHASRALILANHAGDRNRQARIMSIRASVHMIKGDSNAASDCLRQAIKIYEDLGELDNASGYRSTLGRIELERGNFSNAVNHLTSALNGQDPRRETATILCDLALAHAQLGESRTAQDIFSKAIDVAESFGQCRVALRALSGVSECCMSIKRYDEAEEHCRKALRLCERLGDQLLLSEVHATLGSLNRTLGLWKKAESHMLTSINLLKPVKSPQILAQRYRNLAALYELTGDMRKAKRWLNRSAKMMEWNEEPTDIKSTSERVKTFEQ